MAHELAGVLRGAALDPRQAGVLREEDIRDFQFVCVCMCVCIRERRESLDLNAVA